MLRIYTITLTPPKIIKPGAGKPDASSANPSGLCLVSRRETKVSLQGASLYILSF
jgi:hypothetical protein